MNRTKSRKRKRDEDAFNNQEESFFHILRTSDMMFTTEDHLKIDVITGSNCGWKRKCDSHIKTREEFGTKQVSDGLTLYNAFREYLPERSVFLNGQKISSFCTSGSKMRSEQFGRFVSELDQKQFLKCWWCLSNCMKEGNVDTIPLREMVFNDADEFRIHIIVKHHGVFFSQDHSCQLNKVIKAKKSRDLDKRYFYRGMLKELRLEHQHFGKAYTCFVKECGCSFFNLDSLLDHLLRIHTTCIILQMPTEWTDNSMDGTLINLLFEHYTSTWLSM